MALYGMDTEEVRELAASLGRAADDLDRVARTLDSQLTAAPWTGPDAASFRSQWNGPHRAAIRSAADRLGAARSVLLANADAQKDASRADSGTGGRAHRAAAHAFKGSVPAGPDVGAAAADLVQGIRGLLGDASDAVMRAPIVADLITAGLGFQYVPGQDFYTTNQTSVQSHLGFMDAFDDLGFVGGMDLDDSVSTFTYDGQEYRLELWKGSYGGGSAFGGEVGLYVRDPDKEIWESPGQAIPGFYPAADPNERIHMVQEIYDVRTGDPYFTSDGHDTIGSDQYWNAALRTTPGIEKDDLGQRGTLYVDDPGLRDAMYDAMRREGLDVWVDDDAGTVSYDWR